MQWNGELSCLRRALSSRILLNDRPKFLPNWSAPKHSVADGMLDLMFTADLVIFAMGGLPGLALPK